MWRKDEAVGVIFRRVTAGPRYMRTGRCHDQTERLTVVARDEFFDAVHGVLGVFGEAIDREARHFFKWESLFGLYVPFSGQANAIAEFRQAHGHSLHAVGNGAEVVVPPVVDWIHARVKAMPRGHACRDRVEGIVEFDAIGGDSVDVWGAVVFCAEAADVVPSAVVGDYKNKVVAVGGYRILSGSTYGRQSAEHQCALKIHFCCHVGKYSDAQIYLKSEYATHNQAQPDGRLRYNELILTWIEFYFVIPFPESRFCPCGGYARLRNTTDGCGAIPRQWSGLECRLRHGWRL